MTVVLGDRKKSCVGSGERHRRFAGEMLVAPARGKEKKRGGGRQGGIPCFGGGLDGGGGGGKGCSYIYAMQLEKISQKFLQI